MLGSTVGSRRRLTEGVIVHGNSDCIIIILRAEGRSKRKGINQVQIVELRGDSPLLW